MRDLQEAVEYMDAVSDEIDEVANALMGAMELLELKNSLIGRDDDDSRGTKIRCDAAISGIVSLAKWFCDTTAECIGMEVREALSKDAKA